MKPVGVKVAGAERKGSLYEMCFIRVVRIGISMPNTEKTEHSGQDKYAEKELSGVEEIRVDFHFGGIRVSCIRESHCRF